ncbi:MAG: hypothetical protein EOP82_12020 [Variovorax sp.]|nr:MAG: hypothetical protein EOP82_12020 [Variovorax sp.]
MQSNAGNEHAWPALDYIGWRDTVETFQLWTQIVGKVRLTCSPWLNHGWQVPLYVNARGLSTSAVHAGGRIFEIDLDLVDHRLVVRTPGAADLVLALEPMTVAAFYRRFMDMLDSLGLAVTIDTMPNEVAQPIRFPEDEVHAAYDAAAVNAFWRALVQCDRVFKVFRTSFLGKASPVHLFWGALDLAVTRFSGRAAPLHPGGVPGLPDSVTREAYSHEVSSAGFWPGNERFPQAGFYSYAYPTPQGFAEARIEPEAAFWTADLGEWLLPYDAVRTADDPDAVLLRFLETTYRAVADLAGWDRGLDCATGVPGRPRPVGGA